MKDEGHEVVVPTPQTIYHIEKEVKQTTDIKNNKNYFIWFSLHSHDAMQDLYLNFIALSH